MYAYCSQCFSDDTDKTMAKCAYPSCDADAVACVKGGNCPICGGPMQACGRCGTLNRSLARQCRSCCGPLKYRDVLTGVYSSVVKKWPTPDKRLFTQERFWVTPVAFGGWLWLLRL